MRDKQKRLIEAVKQVIFENEMPIPSLEDIFLIDIHGKEFFDRVNGNTYCSARITVYLKDRTTLKYYVPYDYGGSDYYIQAAREVLREEGILPKSMRSLYDLETHGIILKTHVEKNQTKKDVRAWGNK